jgi:hypothetical protein
MERLFPQHFHRAVWAHLGLVVPLLSTPAVGSGLQPEAGVFVDRQPISFMAKSTGTGRCFASMLDRQKPEAKWCLVRSVAMLCGQPQRGAGQRKSKRVQRRARLEIYDALRIALSKLRASGLLRTKEYTLRAKRIRNEWSFWFVFVPEAPGGDITVLVSDDGKVRLVRAF